MTPADEHEPSLHIPDAIHENRAVHNKATSLSERARVAHQAADAQGGHTQMNMTGHDHPDDDDNTNTNTDESALDDAHGHDHTHDHMNMTAHDQHGEHNQKHMTDHANHDAHANHGAHGGHAGHVAQYRRLFWIMLVIAVPVVGFSPMFAMILGYTVPSTPGAQWISPVLGTVMYVWGGRPFLSGAVAELRARQPGMMLLIALAITVAFLASWGASLGILDHELDFWWELALLIVIMLLGHWIEMRSLAQTSTALESLAALLPDVAERVVGDDVEQVPPSELKVGDTVVVRPGARIPADGNVITGTADVDESMITGESKPVSRGPGDHVVAGTVATDSGLRVRVNAIGDDTALAGIQKLVAQAQASSSRAQRLADRAAGWLFWFALGSAALTAIIWSAIGLPDDAVVRTITVLVIACPHALGLAIPLVVSIATERAASAGILIKDRLALESMRTVTTVLFDKTGTLTTGRPALAGIKSYTDATEQELLGLAASVEADSEHPLARAIVTAAQERGITTTSASDFTASVAVGVSGTVDGRSVSVGGPRLLEQHNLPVPDDTSVWASAGATILYLVSDNTLLGSLALSDRVRPESFRAVKALHERGIQVVMITGDAEPVARFVGTELNVDRVYAGVKPEDKAARIGELQKEGRTVAMVGDGVNDAPALTQADVGIAIGAGTDVAIASAGVILASDNPLSVLSVIDLSTATYRKMKQNLWWAAGYNLISVPLAAGVLAPIGFVLPMAVGALLMSASTVVVALNAQLLRRLDLTPPASPVSTGAAAPSSRH